LYPDVTGRELSEAGDIPVGSVKADSYGTSQPHFRKGDPDTLLDSR